MEVKSIYTWYYFLFLWCKILQTFRNILANTIKCSLYITSFIWLHPHSKPLRYALFPPFDRLQNRAKDIKWLVWGHTASKQQNRCSRPGSSAQFLHAVCHPNLRLEYADDKQVRRNNKSTLRRCGSKEWTIEQHGNSPSAFLLISFFSFFFTPDFLFMCQE